MKNYKVVAVPGHSGGVYEIGYWERPEVKSGWVPLAKVYANRPDAPEVVTVVEACQLKIWLDCDKDLERGAIQNHLTLRSQQEWLVQLSQDSQIVGDAIVDWLVKRIPAEFLGEAAQKVAEIDI